MAMLSTLKAFELLDQAYLQYVDEAKEIGNAAQEGAKLSWIDNKPSVDYKVSVFGYDSLFGFDLQGTVRKVKSFAYETNGLKSSQITLEWLKSFAETAKIAPIVSKRSPVQVKDDLAIFELAQKALFNQWKIYHNQFLVSKLKDHAEAAKMYNAAAYLLDRIIHPKHSFPDYLDQAKTCLGEETYKVFKSVNTPLIEMEASKKKSVEEQKE